MTVFVPVLVFYQALGALIGALSAVWGEIVYVRAMRDGNIDMAERAHLRSIAGGLRFGMFLLLLSSFGLIIAAYTSQAALQPALSENYWTLTTLSCFTIGISWALSRRRISFALGSAIVFTAWWFLAYLTLGQLPALSFGATIMFFLVATAIFYVVLQCVRFLSFDSTKEHRLT